ncbi:MAG TPA: pyridoxamine 5'-phosphate oxidase family protein [Candidatus Angelobacter sp.]|nr:pyridoxamine 5'-phosphate oxidase family protein [Candidatus Angelobacter sp.]
MANEGTSPGAVARGLLRATDRAALATSLAGREPVGAEAWPYASLVLLACDHDAAPLLLMSDLAEHSKNIAADPRAALLIDGTAGRTDPLTGPRVTVLGTVEKTEEPRLKARFVARHPSAALYADFADFHLYRVTVTRAHFVAGFGRIHWIEAADLAFDAGAAGLVESEDSLIQQLDEKADRLAQLATGRRAEGWRVTGIDPEGLDLRREGAVARVEFPAPVGAADAAVATIEALLQAEKARRKK